MDLNKITKVAVFDFDGTLINTTMPEEGKKIWKKIKGEDYPHKGWWSKRESLDINLFSNDYFIDIKEIYDNVKKEENTFVTLCTGRITPLTKQVKAILDKHNFEFDDVVLAGDKRFNNGAKDTVNFKINYLKSLKEQFPNLEKIDFWDDRKMHSEAFLKWGESQEVIFNYYLVEH